MQIESINPVAFGFVQKYAGIDDYTKGSFTLLRNSFTNVWIFSEIKKTSPGIIARFDAPLLEADINYMITYIERMQEITEPIKNGEG